MTNEEWAIVAAVAGGIGAVTGSIALWLQASANRAEKQYQDWLNKICLAILQRQDGKANDLAQTINQTNIGFAARAVGDKVLRWVKPGVSVYFPE